jgi:hypothetical protein
MSAFLYIIIGFVASKTMLSCDVTPNMWQYWVMLACIISSAIIAIFLL